ncbi:MAG: hypothetical protein Satyrvirus6_33 [Satyrvirus sp.]|uniref:Ankyrin repeat protein n=1 Tax=Satyrvirus sp. TaxID=2487771 RepID=A0A3G5AFZ6_9VIRU|nr:MAG: hypothetical protein Satyrvirus6_33 [Satyrvirus sp.]
MDPNDDEISKFTKYVEKFSAKNLEPGIKFENISLSNISLFNINLSNINLFCDFFVNLDFRDKIEIIKFIVSKNKLNFFINATSMCEINLDYGDNIFFCVAVANNSIDIVRYLVQNNIDVTSNNNIAIKIVPNSFLMDEQMADINEKILQILIGNGADVHIDNDFPIRAAATNFRYRTMKVLIDNGANIHANEEYILRTVCKITNTQLSMNSFFSTKDLTYKDKIIVEFKKNLELLIEHGADIRKHGSDALHISIRNQCNECVRMLIECGVDIHAHNDYALYLSLITLNYDCIKMLFDAGMDTKSLNIMSLLCASADPKIFTLLVNNGANFGVPDNFYEAVTSKTSINIIEILCANGVDCKKLLIMLHHLVLGSKEKCALFFQHDDD